MRHTAVVRSLAAKTSKDFFGIHDITSKDVAGAFSSGTKLPLDKIEKKYEPLMRARVRLINEEKDKDVVFGRIRMDRDNVTTKHGQYDSDQTTDRLHDTIEMKQMFVPEEFNKKKSATESTQESDQSPEMDHNIQAHLASSIPNYNPPYKISEVQPARDIKDILELFKGLDDHKKTAVWYQNKPPLTFYFEGVSQEEVQETTSPLGNTTVQLECPSRRAKDKPPNSEEKNHKPNSKRVDIRRPQTDLDAAAGPEGAVAPIHELDRLSIEYALRKGELDNQVVGFDRALDRKFDVDGQSEGQSEPVKAMDHLKKVRSGQVQPSAEKLKRRMETTERLYPLEPSIKLDSHGFRNYSHQVPDWHRIRRVEAIDYLEKCIIYNNYDILALNKPYGLAAHANKKSNDEFDINTLMGEIAKSMRIEKVYLAHRLDKTTTGLLLFATSQQRANDLNKLFKADDIKKTYWCITKGVPSPSRGVIDMPIGEIEVAGKLRSCPAPVGVDEKRQLSRKYREARRAITEYQVLESTKNAAALVELKPQSGVKHQLRCHLSFGLNTPILGDHKYSHLTKLAPQTLPPNILKALHLRQSKVRTLPMHLHAKSIVIPGVKANGETLFITAPLPRHFVDNMKAIKLKNPDGSLS